MPAGAQRITRQVKVGKGAKTGIHAMWAEPWSDRLRFLGLSTVFIMASHDFRVKTHNNCAALSN
jgi:hypothetical protein